MKNVCTACFTLTLTAVFAIVVSAQKTTTAAKSGVKGVQESAATERDRPLVLSDGVPGPILKDAVVLQVDTIPAGLVLLAHHQNRK